MLLQTPNVYNNNYPARVRLTKQYAFAPFNNRRLLLDWRTPEAFDASQI